MAFLFSYFIDDSKFQGNKITSSEVMEPLSDGLGFELLVAEQVPTPNLVIAPLHPISRTLGVISSSRKGKKS